MKKLYVLDGTGYIFRSYYALQGMTDAQGKATNALFGFIRGILKLIKDYQPEHLVAVFDDKDNKKSRTDIYAGYKANRSAAPDDLIHQMQWAKDFCALYGISTLSIPGVEADDTMATAARWAGERGWEVYLITSDKDLFQMVNDKTFILQTFKDNLIIDAQKVQEIFGVEPQQIVDYLALTGDASDNVPGVPGIGGKTAASLLNEFHTLEQLYSSLEKVSGKKRQQALQDNQELAFLSKKLVQVDKGVDIPDSEEFFLRKELNIKELQSFYSDRNFRSLLADLSKEGEKTESLPKNENYLLVDSEEALEDLRKRLKEAKEICFDTETTSLRPTQAELVGIGFCIESGVAYYLPVNGHLGLKRVVDFVKPIFADPAHAFFGHNAKYDLHVLLNCGIAVANLGWDTILASYLLNSHSHRHSLDQLCLQYFDKVKIATEELIGKGRKQITMDQVPIEKVCHYCCEDVDYTFRLKQVLMKEMQERKLLPLLLNLELPLTKILFKMERHGIFADRDFLNTLSAYMKEKTERIAEEIQELAGEQFNVNSTKQLAAILFGKMGIHPPKKTATGYSTDAEVLELLAHQHPIAQKILEYRVLEKLRTTYAESLPQEINPKTGKIHCTFNQSVAATGRLSCQDPNLQNIPVRSHEGRKIREAFRPEKSNWSYLAADYSQIELRLLAHLSEDPKLVAAFKEGRDVHVATAAEIFGISPQEVTKEQRDQAKTVNFGIIYGQQAFGLSRQLNIPVRTASAFIDTYFAKYQKVGAFIEACKEHARKTGKSATMTGRERIIPDITARNPILRAAAERLAVNTPLQGTAADLIKLAMLEVDKQLQKQQMAGYLVLQIHDELILELPDHETITMESLVKKAMEGVFDLKVPLVVDIMIGKNWKEC